MWEPNSVIDNHTYTTFLEFRSDALTEFVGVCRVEWETSLLNDGDFSTGMEVTDFSSQFYIQKKELGKDW